MREYRVDGLDQILKCHPQTENLVNEFYCHISVLVSSIYLGILIVSFLCFELISKVFQIFHEKTVKLYQSLKGIFLIFTKYNKVAFVTSIYWIIISVDFIHN